MKRFVESVADLGFVAWGGEENFKRALECPFLWGKENFKRAPTLFLIVGWEEFQEGTCMVFDCGVRRISIRRLYDFRLWARRNSRGHQHNF